MASNRSGLLALALVAGIGCRDRCEIPAAATAQKPIESPAPEQTDSPPAVQPVSPMAMAFAPRSWLRNTSPKQGKLRANGKP